MTNKELQTYLQQHPDEMEVRIRHGKDLNPLSIDNIHIYSDTAVVDDEAPEDEWDTEDGKIDLGDGEKYLLFMAEVY